MNGLIFEVEVLLDGGEVAVIQVLAASREAAAELAIQELLETQQRPVEPLATHAA